MNRKIIYASAALMMLYALFSPEVKSQTVVKIGEAEIAIQSPISIKKRDTVDRRSISKAYGNNEIRVVKRSTYPKYYEDFFIGIGMAVPTDNGEFLPMHYGSSYSLEAGYKYFYRPSKRYALGTTFQYTFYNFKLKDAAQTGVFESNVPGNVKKEYYRTDNLGTGLINRFYLFPIGNSRPFTLDLGGYLDFSFSKRYNVKTVENGRENKYKYRDGSKFNPVQAGLYGAISKGSYSLYARYRLTNLFNPESVPMELPRFSLGIQVLMD